MISFGDCFDEEIALEVLKYLHDSDKKYLNLQGKRLLGQYFHQKQFMMKAVGMDGRLLKFVGFDLMHQCINDNDFDLIIMAIANYYNRQEFETDRLKSQRLKRMLLYCNELDPKFSGFGTTDFPTFCQEHDQLSSIDFDRVNYNIDDELKSHEAFIIFLGGINQKRNKITSNHNDVEGSGCSHLPLLDIGIHINKMIAEYSDIPFGSKLKTLRKAKYNIRVFPNLR